MTRPFLFQFGPIGRACGHPRCCDVYYPHLSRAKRLEKARNMEFPFLCYRLDESQKSPYLVDIFDLAFVLENRYKAQLEEFKKFMQSILKSDQHK